MDTITNSFNLDYDYKIDPNGNTNTNSLESNIVTTDIVLGSLNMVKSVDKAYATIGDVLNYTIDINNNGTILVTDVLFKDVLSTGVSFVAGSVKINDIVQPTYDISSGFNIGSMIIGATIKVTFQATITSLPNPNTIVNKATTTFNYLVIGIITGSAESNSVSTVINVTDVTLTKSADVETVESGDEITYTNILVNNGNIDATNINFTDTLSDKVTFVEGSVTINGTNEATYNPNIGFNVGTIVPGDTMIITFKVTVN